MMPAKSVSGIGIIGKAPKYISRSLFKKSGLRANQKLFGVFIGALLLFYWPTCLWSQEKLYHLSLTKDNLSWNWNGRLSLEHGSKSRHRFFFDNRYNSNLFRETNRENKWKDENQLGTGWEFRLTPLLTTTLNIQSHIFSDQNSAVDFNKNLVLQKFQYQPVHQILLTPAAGWATEEIYGVRDQGWYAEMNLAVRDYDMAGYINRTDAFGSAYFFPGRRNQEHRYYTSFEKQFSDVASDSIRIGYEYRDNSYYLSQDNNLESVESNSRYLYNLLTYRLGEISRFEVETRLQTRDISQSNNQLLNHRNDLDFVNRLRWRHDGKKWQQGVAFISSQITNLASRRPSAEAETRTDVEGLRAAFNLYTNWFISASDEIRLTFSYTKYEYTSPDTALTIDEDDLRFISSLNYRHKFSPYFSAEIMANLYLYHQIYLHAERSANNNWNRIVQLAPTFRLHIPGVLEHKNRLHILANYTVFDFDEVLPEVRSFVHRKLVYTDSLALFLTRGLNFLTVYEMEREDNGTFFKNIFAEQISRELSSHQLDLSLVYRRIKGAQLITGVNWYIRREWTYFIDLREGNIRRPSRDYRAFSPRLALICRMGKRLLLHLSISRKTYNDLNIKRQYYSTGQVNLRYLF